MSITIKDTVEIIKAITSLIGTASLIIVPWLQWKIKRLDKDRKNMQEQRNVLARFVVAYNNRAIPVFEALAKIEDDKQGVRRQAYDAVIDAQREELKRSS